MRLAPGASFDRYRILHEIGEDTAGVVYAAFDPTLDRKVALRVLDDKSAIEERALAKVSDPNVVTIYEIGSFDGQRYIAFELVEGVTAREWVAKERRSWREVCDVYVAAGRGLAALHRAGLVHGEVAAENITVAGDGAVRLVGLAATTRGDAASDQYALCAAMRDALRSVDRCPRRVRRAVARGMAAQPGARFASVSELVRVLAEHRRWPVALVVGATLIVAAGAAFAVVMGSGSAEDPCARASDGFYPAFDAARVDAALAQSERPHAPDTRARVVPGLRGYAEAWRDQRVAVCRAYHERHEISGDQFDLRVACLDGRRAGFEATVQRLVHPGVREVDRAIELVGALPAVAECADATALARTQPMPADVGQRRMIERIEAALDEAGVASRAGDDRSAIATARSALSAARAALYRPTLAHAALALAELLMRADLRDEARPLIEEAIQLAAVARLDQLEAQAWIAKLALLEKAPEAEGAIARTAAVAAADRAGTDLTRARLANELGLVAHAEGKFAEARDQFRRAIKLYEAADVKTGAIADTLANLSRALGNLGDLAGARAAAADALKRDLAMYGAHHPNYAGSLVALSVESEPSDALPLLEQALAIAVATYGERSGRAMVVHSNLADNLDLLGRFDDAERHAEVALSIAQELRGPDDIDVAKLMSRLGEIAAHRNDLARAVEWTGRAIAIAEAKLGPKHPLAGSLHASRAEWLLARGDAVAAERDARIGVDVLSAATNGPDVAHARGVLGESLDKLGRHREAVAQLEAALTIRVRTGDRPILVAYAQFVLARALVADGQTARGSRLASTAAAALATLGDEGATYLTELQEWARRVHLAIAPPG